MVCLGYIHSHPNPDRWEHILLFWMNVHSIRGIHLEIIQADVEKEEEPEIKLPTSVGSEKKQENSRKTSISVSLTTLKSLTVWVTTNCGKF